MHEYLLWWALGTLVILEIKNHRYLKSSEQRKIGESNAEFKEFSYERHDRCNVYRKS